MTGVFWRDIRRAILGIPFNQLLAPSSTRLSRSLAERSSSLRLRAEPVKGSAPHISYASRHRIRFVLFCLRSTLLTESLLLSFPAGTEMLQFPAFPFLIGTVRESTVQSLHAARRGLSQLATPFNGSQA